MAFGQLWRGPSSKREWLSETTHGKFARFKESVEAPRASFESFYNLHTRTDNVHQIAQAARIHSLFSQLHFYSFSQEGDLHQHIR